MGDRVANLAQASGWSGLVLHAAVRDIEALARIDIGIRALAGSPKKSGKQGNGERDLPVSFAGVTFTAGDWLVADADGIVVAPAALAGLLQGAVA